MVSSGLGRRSALPNARRRSALAQAPQIGMQPRSPTGEPVPRIGNDDPVHGHDAQQLGGPFPGSAADARPNRTVGRRPNRVRSWIASAAMTM